METRTFEGELSHFGVKGMRWGVRKDRSSGGSSVGEKVKVARANYQIKKELARPHSDEAKIAKAIRAKAKTKGTQSLTNEEMRVLLDRISLEDRYAKSVTGKNFINSVLTSPATGLAISAGRMFAGDDPRVRKGLDFADLLIKATAVQKKK